MRRHFSTTVQLVFIGYLDRNEWEEHFFAGHLKLSKNWQTNQPTNQPTACGKVLWGANIPSATPEIFRI